MFLQIGFDLRDAGEDLVAGALGFEDAPEGFIPQRVTETREQVKVRPNRRADDGKEAIDGLAVDGHEVDGLFEEAQGEGGAGHVQDDGIANVRDGDALADARGGHFLSGQQDAQEELAVHLVGQMHKLYDGAQGGGLVLAADAVVDAARPQRRFETLQLCAGGLGLAEELRGDVDAVGHGPFEQLGPVETVLVVDAVSGQGVLVKPAVDCFLAYLK